MGYHSHVAPNGAVLAGSVAALQQHPVVQQQIQALQTVDEDVLKQKVKEHTARVKSELQVDRSKLVQTVFLEHAPLDSSISKSIFVTCVRLPPDTNERRCGAVEAEAARSIATAKV